MPLELSKWTFVSWLGPLSVNYFSSIDGISYKYCNSSMIYVLNRDPIVHKTALKIKTRVLSTCAIDAFSSLQKKSIAFEIQFYIYVFLKRIKVF